MSQESPLTRRETEILGLIAQGLSNDEIAQELTISPNTVKVHVRNIFDKMGVQSRTEASMEAVKRGWVVVPGLSVEKAAPPSSPWPPLEVAISPWRWLVLFILLVLAGIFILWPPQRFYTTTNAPDFTTDASLPVAAVSPRIDTPRWFLLSPMPTARSRMAAALASDGWHLIGGENAQGDLNAHEIYTPAWDQWRTAPPRPVAARAAAAASLNEKIYVAGGCREATPLDRLDVFNTETNTWQVAAPLPKPLCGAMFAVWGDALYLFGGWDGNEVQGQGYRFDPQTGSWSLVTTMPEPRAFAGVAVTPEAIYLLGGHDGHAQRAEVWRYLPQEDRWESLPSMPAAASGLAVAADVGSIYVITGGEGQEDYPRERFDLTTQSWSTLEAPRRGPWHHAAAVVLGPNLHIVGGWGGDYLAIHEVYQTSHLIFLPAQQGSAHP